MPRTVTCLIVVLGVVGVLAPPADALTRPAPVVRLGLSEHAQHVSINGVRVSLGGEAVADTAGRVRAALGPRDGCRVIGRPGRDTFAVSRWRATAVLVRTQPYSGEPDCDAPTEVVMSIVLGGQAGEVVTEHGTVRVGGRVPARLRAAPSRVRVISPRSVITWPRVEPCTGLHIPGSTALLVRTLRGRIVSATVYTGVREVVTCDGF